MEDTSNQMTPVELLAHEFMDRQQRGEKPTIREYCDRHPELADEIREVFEAVAMVEELKPNSEDVGGTIGAAPAAISRQPAQVGAYRILREVGRGGMGVVYEAEQESLRRRVALKVMPRNVAGDGKSLLRFQREARAAARMHHTNIVPVFEVGEDDTHVFYAMQLIQGQALDLVVDELKQFRTEQVRIREKSGIGVAHETNRLSQTEQCSLAESLIAGKFQQEKLIAENEDSLQPEVTPVAPEPSGHYEETVDQRADSTQSAVLPGNSPLSTAEGNRNAYFHSVAEIGLQTAQALAYAHARGIVHRDIKPANLILDSAGVVWITDFGLAKTTDESMTHTGDILGTIRYMSPERFRGQCDVRADVYSLGLTLYELLVLRPAFVSPDRLRLIEMVKSANPPAPRSLDNRIPRDLETIVLKCADKDVRRRYQSADELCEDLERFIQDQPIKARRVSVAERAWRWSSHNKGLATALGVIAALLLAINIIGPILTWKVAVLNDDLEAKNLNLTNTRDQLRDQRNRAEELATVAVNEASRAKQNAAIADAEREAARRVLYSADMNLAQNALASGNSGRASKLIDRHWPNPEQEDLRCWAWRHLWQRSRGDQLESMGPLETSAFTIDFTPDNALFAVCDMRGKVSLWDVASRRKVATLVDDGLDCGCVAFSPNGKMLAATGARGRIELWDLESGTSLPPLSILSGIPLLRIRSLGFSADGNRLCIRARSPFSNHIVVRDLETDSVLFSQLADDLSSSAHHGVARISPDGATVYSGGGRRIKAFNIDSGEQLFDIGAHENGITALAVSPDGKLLASGSGYSETMVKVWRADDGQLVGQFEGHTGWIPWLEFMPDSKSVVSASADQTTRIWDAETFEEKTVLRGHQDEVYGLSISSDGKSIVTASKDGTMNLWDAEPQDRMAVYVRGENEKRPFDFSPHGGSLLTVKGGNVLELDPNTLEQVRTLPGLSQVRDVATLQDRRHLLVRTYVGSEIYNYVEERVVHQFDGPRLAATFLPEQNRIAALSAEEIEYWDPTNWEMTRSVKLEESAKGAVLAPTADVLAKRSGSELSIWRLIDGQWQRKVVQPQQRSISSFAFSPDGKYVATSSQDGTACIIDVATGRILHRLRGHVRAVHSICFSPDGRRIATGGGDGDSVKVWDVINGQEVVTLAADSMLVQSIRFSPDGNAIAASSNSRTVRHLWRAPSQEQIDKQQESRIRRIQLSASNQSALSIEAKNVIRKIAQSYSEQLDALPEGNAAYLARSRFLQSIIQESQLFDQLRQLRPDDVLPTVCLARIEAMQGHWQEAADRYSVVTNETPGELWYEYGAVLLLAGRVDDYQRLVARFADEVEPDEAGVLGYVLARVSAVSTHSPIPSSDVVAMAERAAKAKPMAWIQHAAAVAHYRAGNLNEALQWTEKSLKTQRRWHPELADLVKTLVYRQQGKEEEEAKHWKRVQDWRADVESDAAMNLQVTDWLEAQLLIREVEQQLMDSADIEQRL